MLPDRLSSSWSHGWLHNLDWTRGTTGNRLVTVYAVVIGHTSRLMPAVCRFDVSASARGRISSGRCVCAHCSVEEGEGWPAGCFPRAICLATLPCEGVVGADGPV